MDAGSDPDSHSSSVPPTPDVQRRTRSLALQDRQWDALFGEGAPSSPNVVTPHREVASIEEAHAVAKAKLARPKRKRICTPDDIFRSKKPDRTPNTPQAPETVFSRFLSNHPALAHSLCFATPVRDSHEDLESVVSDTNTLNTAEDTITSTLYYEQTKLAGLHQIHPPMPLFNHFAVEQELSEIVASERHSSARLRAILLAAKGSEDDLPPPMVHSSSSSSTHEPRSAHIV
jgi:hypothetical protein